MKSDFIKTNPTSAMSKPCRKMKTALQNFLEQIVLKQVEGSVCLFPTITDIQIKKALEEEYKQILEAFVAGDERETGNIPFTAEQYYTQTFNQKNPCT